MIKNKKAQITVFIIIGIIILGGVGLYAALRKQEIAGELTPEIELTLEEVPAEFMPVDSFVKGCIQAIAEEGITRLGERGGFISPSRYGITSTNEPTESDAVKRSPTSDYEIPYWYYMKSPNDCFGECDFITVPDNQLYLYKKEGEEKSKPSIESQIEEYINDNLDICLSDFNALKEQGFNVNILGDISTKASIRDNEVLILVDYPLEFSKIGKKEISKFFVRIPVNLKGIYELSKEIVGLQGQYRYLEKHLENLMAGFDGVNYNKLPPTHETVLQPGSEITWEVGKVETDMKNMLASYVQSLQVSNTANYEPLYRRNALSNALYNSGMLIPVDGNYYNLEASFIYYPDWWPIYFDIDCKGGTCRPEPFSSSNIMALIGFQRYSFVYDISFPVEVQIKDESAFNNRGYSFSFLMESNTRDNNPMPADYISFPLVQSGDSMLCDVDKRTSGNITVKVFDADNYKVDNANVIYTCMGEDSCSMGKTQDGILTAKFPPCMGGIVSVMKEGYLGQSQPLDVDEGVEASVEFTLNPIMIKNFIVKKKMINRTKIGNTVFWNPTLTIADLKPNERAVVLLEKIESIEEESFKTGGNYEGNQTEPSEIRIGAGKFKVTIYLLLDEKIIIPANETEEGSMDELPELYTSGGLIANFTFSNYNLQNADTIVFYALSPNLYDVPKEERTSEDMLYATNMEGYSRYWYGAWPDFK